MILDHAAAVSTRFISVGDILPLISQAEKALELARLQSTELTRLQSELAKLQGGAKKDKSKKFKKRQAEQTPVSTTHVELTSISISPSPHVVVQEQRLSLMSDEAPPTGTLTPLAGASAAEPSSADSATSASATSEPSSGEPAGSTGNSGDPGDQQIHVLENLLSDLKTLAKAGLI